ncbi:MAG: hypothetical protein D4R63_07615, partial [Methylococcaceae bacterium]
TTNSDAYGNSYTSANRYDANWTLLESTNSDSSGNNSVMQYQTSVDAEGNLTGYTHITTNSDAYGNSYTSANRYDANWTLLESTNSDSSGNNSVTQYQTSADAATEVVSVIDKIELHNDVMKTLGLTEDTITIDKFWTDAEVAEGRDASDRIIYNTTTDALYYNADGSVNTASIQIELMGLSTHPTMTYQDLLIV